MQSALPQKRFRIVTDAVAGDDKRNDTKGQSTGYNDARDHDISNAASLESVCRG